MSPSRYFRNRSVCLFIGLTLLYTLAFVFFCGGGGRQGPGADAATTTAALEEQLRIARNTPIQQLKCRPCPECPVAAPCVAAPPPPPPPPPPAPVVAPATPSLATFSEVPLLTPADGVASHNLDSTGSVYTVRGRGDGGRRSDEYKLCSFTRACVQTDRLLLGFADVAQAAAWKADWTAKCWKVPQWEQPPICSCFHPNFLPDFLSSEQLALTQSPSESMMKPAHYWSMHKWVDVHHIAHWAQKLIVWQSLYQHVGPGRALARALPALDGLVFQDSDLPLSDHEQVIFDAALAALDQPAGTHPLAAKVGRDARLIWASTLLTQRNQMDQMHAAQLAAGQPIATQSSQLTCFDRVSFVPHYGIFSTHPDDTSKFRDAVYAHFGRAPAQRCPPHRAVLLYRHNRVMLNREEVQRVLKAEFDLDLEYLTIDESSSSAEQVALFASTGLLLSSHSSQLINVLFSPPGAAMVEVAPEFYNADFSEYAHGMGIFFQYALGGDVPDGTPQPLQRECVEHLSHCEGASYCIIDQRYNCKNTEYPNKNLAFNANITAVRIAVKNSVQHLNWLCTGRW